MTRNEITGLMRDAGFDNLPEADYWYPSFKHFANLVAQHERERIFGELLRMHEIASSRHNYYLHAVVTIRARGEAPTPYESKVGHMFGDAR